MIFFLKSVTVKRNKVTPTWLLIDRAGHLRKQTFGHVTDIQVGAEGSTPNGRFTNTMNGSTRMAWYWRTAMILSAAIP